MSDSVSQVSTLPSSENSENRDYGDRDGHTILFPPKEPEELTPSTEVRINSAKLRLRNKVKEINGDDTVEFIDYLTDLVYNYIHFEKMPPSNMLERVKYIKNRIYYR